MIFNSARLTLGMGCIKPYIILKIDNFQNQLWSTLFNTYNSNHPLPIHKRQNYGRKAMQTKGLKSTKTI